MEKKQEIQEKKDELQLIMTHKIVILRDILSTLRQEQNALMSDDHPTLKAIIDDRFILISTFNEWNVRFIPVLKQLSVCLNLTFVEKTDEAFLDHLKKLGEFLNEEDFELLLAREQLIEMVEEIQKQTSATLYYLENKNSMNDGGHSPVHMHGNFLKFAFKKEPFPKKTMVGLMESDQKDLE